MKPKKVIKLPHLGDVLIMVYKKTKDDECPDADGYVKWLCAEEIELHVKLPIKGKISAGHLVHEIVHILQHIVEDNCMTFLNEREHLAYIAGYIFEQVCDI